MATISSGIGLVTGMDIESTISALMKLSAARRDKLSERTDTIKAQQVAVTELSALLLSVRYISNNLGKEDLYEKREASSSNESALTASVTGKPAVGTYQFTPVQTAQQQQWLSAGFTSATSALEAGSMTIRYGSDVERSTSLDLFNGGQGIQRGKIRITDRSGANTQIDLSTVQTVDDILKAINSNTTINVTAVATGDGFTLIDNTGQAVSNLKVQEVAGGSTAASLGLGGVDVADSVAEGADILYLHDDLRLDDLNDGNGVRMGALSSAGLLNNFHYELRDGTSADATLFPTDASGRTEDVTLGDILEAFNAIDPEKLRMEISSDGERLVVRDLTEGEGTTKIETKEGRRSEVIEDLGLNVESSEGMVVGRRLLGGTKSVLLSSLNGGKGLGKLGAIELTDRAGATDTVNLADAETLEDVVNKINAAEVGVVAQVNRAGNGIELIDTTGKSASNLIVADAETGSGTAAALGLDVDQAVSTVNSGDMHLQVVSHNMKLSDLNGGRGVNKGTLTVNDASGHTNEVNLNDPDVQTVGDVLDKLHQETTVWLSFEINQNGDGIWIRDYNNLDSPPAVTEGDRSIAADLGLLGGAKKITYDGQECYVIDGSTTKTVQWQDGDTLQDVLAQFDALGNEVTATTFNDGSNRPVRLSLSSVQTGLAGRLVVDTSNAGFNLTESVAAQDAVMVFGNSNIPGANVVATSRTNAFTGLIEGLTLNVQQPSTVPVTVQVSRSVTDVNASAKVLVDKYNAFRERYDELTAYEAETDTTGALFTDPAARRALDDIANALTDRFLGLGSLQSLADVGITMGQTGTLTYDESVLKAAFNEDPDAVRDFFVGVEPDQSGEDLGISLGTDWITVDEDKLNKAYAENPTAVIDFFARVRGRYSFEELGIAFEDGKVTVDKNQLQAKYTGDKTMAEQLGYKKSKGVSELLGQVLEGISGQDVSLFATRYLALNSKIEKNEEKIEAMDEQLKAEEIRLYTQFYRMELAIAKLMSNQDALAAITTKISTGSSSKSSSSK